MYMQRPPFGFSADGAEEDVSAALAERDAAAGATARPFLEPRPKDNMTTRIPRLGPSLQPEPTTISN